jgi:hypothetical protein
MGQQWGPLRSPVPGFAGLTAYSGSRVVAFTSSSTA